MHDTRWPTDRAHDLDDSPSNERIATSDGRELFGGVAESYAKARPDYPSALLQILVDHRALVAGVHTLEIGAGRGLATRQLIARGANPLTVVEPDRRFAKHLMAPNQMCDFRLYTQAFEDTKFAPASFELAVLATSLPCIDPKKRVCRLAAVVKAGGFVAILNNVLQDPNKADEFHDATQSILQPLDVSPSGAPDTVPFAHERAAREAEFSDAGWFTMVAHWAGHSP